MKQDSFPSPATEDPHSPRQARTDADAGIDAPLPFPAVREIFISFLKLGFMSFGGAMPIARRALVEQRHWLSPAEFTELLGLCQFLPGGNAVNLSVAVGMRFRGWRGALAGLLGLMAGPSIVVIGLGVLYERTQDNPYVHRLFGGLAAAAAGLLVAMALKVMQPLWHDAGDVIIMALCFIAIGFLHLSLLPTMLALTTLGIVLALKATRTTGTMK